MTSNKYLHNDYSTKFSERVVKCTSCGYGNKLKYITNSTGKMKCKRCKGKLELEDPRENFFAQLSAKCYIKQNGKRKF